MLASFSLIAANNASCLLGGDEAVWRLQKLNDEQHAKNRTTFYKIKAAIDNPDSAPPCSEPVCVLLHLQHLLQMFPALGSQGCEMCLLLTQRLLGGGQLGPHRLQLLFHLLHGAQQLLHLGTQTH